MKILKIFGIVATVHLVAFMFVFAIPGCRSTTRRAPSPSETAASNGDGKVYYPGLTGYSTTTPPDTNASSQGVSGDLMPVSDVPPLDFSQSAGATPEVASVRFTPTRPNTATASALQTTPVTDVQRVTTYTVANRDSLWTIARKHGISVAELAAANNLRSDAVLSVGKKLVIPAKAAPADATAGSGIGGDAITYTVKSGDSLGQIARRAGVTVGAIKTVNKLKGDVLTVGQKLILPSSGSVAPSSSAGAAPAPAHAVIKPSAEDTEHVVQANETLSQIARRYGVTQRAIGAANHISDPAKLRPGQKLIIPGAGRMANPPAPTPAARPAEVAPAPAAPPPPSPAPEAPAGPVSPVAPEDSGPISAPSDAPPIVPVEGSSPIAPAQG